MQNYETSMSAPINAPAKQVYAIIADYHNSHPHILPKQYFTQLVVEEGGIGAGTRIRFEMNVMGRKSRFQAQITEPEPGRVLVESNQSDSLPPSVTTFTVDPIAGGQQARVTIQTVGQARDGFAGKVEAFFAKQFLRRVYRQELALLAALAESQK